MTEQSKNIKIGDVIEGCNFHIGKVVDISYEKDDVRHVSMFNGKTYGCSLKYCGVFVVPQEEVDMKLNLFEKEGMDGIYRLWYGNESGE